MQLQPTPLRLTDKQIRALVEPKEEVNWREFIVAAVLWLLACAAMAIFSIYLADIFYWYAGGG